METVTFLKGVFSKRNEGTMQNNEAFYSKQTFTINGNSYTTRVYYADSAAFKDALKAYKPKPVSYKDSPFFALEAWHNSNQNQGFAYYTYGEDGSINMFTYVNENKVYQTTDEGKTWQDITPGEK